MTTPRAATTTTPFVAVIIPCRNEAMFIGPVIDSILSSSYPRDRLEVIFVDGMSTDGTRAILEGAVREHSFIRVLDNPLFTTPVAMNTGIRAARGEIIVRMDAHAEYTPDYIPRCVRLLLQSGPKVGSVGGRSVAVPNGDSPWARSVAFVTMHRFGVGNAAYKISLRPGLVDTVALGTFSRAVLDEVGMYDERLTRNQDNELNARLQKAGYSIAYDPSIQIYYRNQAELKGLVRQAFFTGMWNVYTLSLHPYTWKWRRFVPMAFVAYLALLGAAASSSAPRFGAAPLPLGLYAVIAAVISIGNGGSAGGCLRVAATFVSYHLSYGIGSFVGAANVLTGRWKADLGRPLIREEGFTTESVGPPTTGSEPFVTVVIPCRNEAPFIRPVIDSLLLSSYPREKLEVIFVDGMSTDGTRAIIERAAGGHAFIRVLDNPMLTAPIAMNLGIQASRGEIIVRMDAHSEYPVDYIPRCVRLLKSGPRIGNAGGRLMTLPNGEGPWARAVAYVTAHRFGVGGTAFRTGSRAGPVDTVPFGTFSRAALDEVGLYDVRLTRNQDNELNARLQRAGYTIAFDPTIRINYRNQANLKGLVRQAFYTSMWNVYTLAIHPYTWKWRRFVPMGFVAYVVVLTAAASFSARGTAAAALPLGLYAVLVAAFSFGSDETKGSQFPVAATFVSYHLSYGVGSFFGIANVLTGRWRDELGRPLLK